MGDRSNPKSPADWSPSLVHPKNFRAGQKPDGFRNKPVSIYQMHPEKDAFRTQTLKLCNFARLCLKITQDPFGNKGLQTYLFYNMKAS
ncbi:MAG TPA: hypothetical protein DDW78_04270 [Treponema sp.]|nr:hypothetical protein [Treponema sp.]